jgi:hypothetical protein
MIVEPPASISTLPAIEEAKRKAAPKEIPVKRAASKTAKVKTTTTAKQNVKTPASGKTELVSLGKYKLGARVSKSPGCEQVLDYDDSSRDTDTEGKTPADPGPRN